MKYIFLVPLFLLMGLCTDDETIDEAIEEFDSLNACTESYEGPQLDIQLDAFCIQAWGLVCTEGSSKDDLNATCELLAEARALTTDGTYPPCPYCD